MKISIALVSMMTIGLLAQTPARPSGQQPGARGQRAQRGPQAPRGPENLAWVDRTGNVLGKIGQQQAAILDPAISPDGRKVAVRGRDQQSDRDSVWIHEGTTKKRLTTNTGNERHNFWSAKGDQIVYTMQMPGQGSVSNLFIRAADGSGADRPLVVGEGVHKWSPTWSPDGRFIVYHNNDLATNARDIMFVDVTTGKTDYLVQSPATEALPRFSTDGRYVAYQAQEEGGRFEVWVTTFPKSDNKWKVSTNGGIWPRWSKDEIFYWEGNSMVAVKFTAQGSNFTVTPPQKLFTSAQVGMGVAAPSGYNFFYDYYDGKFVVVQRNPPPPARER
jgi:Tol biopolymer transport system component